LKFFIVNHEWSWLNCLVDHTVLLYKDEVVRCWLCCLHKRSSDFKFKKMLCLQRLARSCIHVTGCHTVL